MTGFSSMIVIVPRQRDVTLSTQTGTKSVSDHPLQMTMTLKTLNSRFFECTCKLPYSLAFLETDLLKYFKSKLYRGNIVFSIHVSDPSAISGSIEPSITAVTGYLTAIEKIKTFFPVTGSLSINDLIHLPNVFETKESTLDQDTIDRIMAAIEELTLEVQQARIKEGKALTEDLAARIKAMQDYLNVLEPRAQVVMEQKKEVLFATLPTALKETEQDTATDAQTTLIYNQLERIDIHEEIVRFKTHLANLESLIYAKEQELGKKLDFTLQELFRETNTIASKCNDSIISSLAINIKVELEKSREQAQNIV